MLVIRLARKGRRNRPTYRITVAEHSRSTNGKFVEVVGHYDPVANDQPLKVDKERVDYWISQGAQVSNTVAKLLNRTGYKLEVVEKNKAPKKEVKKEEQPVAKPADTVESAPKEDVPAEAEKPVAESEKPTDVVEPAPKEDVSKEKEPAVVEDASKDDDVVKEEELKSEESSEDKPVE